VVGNIVNDVTSLTDHHLGLKSHFMVASLRRTYINKIRREYQDTSQVF